MNINSIAQNAQMKDILAKAGVPQEQAIQIANQAMQAIKGQFDQNPAQITNLLAQQQPNNEAHQQMRAEIEQNFAQNLIANVGLPEGIAHQVKGAMPNILNQVQGSIAALGANNPQAIAGALDKIAKAPGKDDEDEFIDRLFNKPE